MDLRCFIAFKINENGGYQHRKTYDVIQVKPLRSGSLSLSKLMQTQKKNRAPAAYLKCDKHEISSNVRQWRTRVPT